MSEWEKGRYPKTFGITRLCGYPGCRMPHSIRYRQRRFGKAKGRVWRLFRCNRHPIRHLRGRRV